MVQTNRGWSSGNHRERWDSQCDPIDHQGTSDVDNNDNRDFNYFLGINNDTSVLIADFEEGAGGSSPSLNHPVSGTTPIVMNTWYHAVATYDGATWKLYLNGNLEASLAVGQPPRSDNSSPVAMASSIKNDGTSLTPQGYFNGILDEARIWNYARSQTEIQGTMNSPITSHQNGLVARWGLNETTGTTVSSSAGTSVNGTISGTGNAWVGGVPAIVNHAAAFVSGSPDDLATDVSTSPTLSLTASDVDLDNLTVQFFGRAKADDFTIIALPDTQSYSANTTNPTYSAVFNSQTNWIANNAASRNIAFVTHLGDSVNSASTAAEWTRAVAAMNILDATGIPYGLTIGNHDQNPYGTAGGTTEFNNNFGISRFTGRLYYGGGYNSKNDDSYQLFSAGGMDFIVIHLEYNDGTDQAQQTLRAAEISWADGLLQTFSSRRAIVVTHNLLNGSSLTPQGAAIWNEIKDRPNLFLMPGRALGSGRTNLPHRYKWKQGRFLTL